DHEQGRVAEGHPDPQARAGDRGAAGDLAETGAVRMPRLPLALVLLASCAGPGKGVPDEVLADGEWTMEQFAGGWHVRVPRFERWLVEGDAVRRRNALQDERLLDSA